MAARRYPRSVTGERRAKILRTAAGAIGALVLLYYVGVNAVLASPLGEALFNVRPDQVQVHYQRAWTLFPGRVEVRGFQLSMQDHAVQLMITADRVKGALHPWTLRELRFYATDLEGEGVTFRLRPLIDESDPAAAHLDELPPIAGFETPVRQQTNLKPGKGPKLLVELADLRVTHLREVWVDRVRYTGDAEVEGGMFYAPLERLRLDAARFTDAKSILVANGRAIPLERLELQVALEEIDLTALDLAAFRALSAKVELEAFVDPRFLNGYLSRVKGLSTLVATGAEGRLQLGAQLERGVVKDGAQLSYGSPRLAVRLPYVDVGGAAAVKGGSREGRLSLDVNVSKARLRQHDGQPLAEADAFSLAASSDADLTKLDEVDALLALSGGRVKQLTALNEFIPAGAGVRFTGGEGAVEGRLRLDAAPARGKGSLELIASDVTVKNRSATVSGRLVVHGEVRALDLRTGALDLSGSTVALEDATVTQDGKRWPVWVRAVAEPCLLTPQAKVRWAATLSLGASNLQPLLAVVSANVPVPKALSLFTNSPNVRAEASLVVKEDGIELPRLLLTSQSVRLEGALSLREAQDERLEPWGDLLLQLGVLKAGLQLEGPRLSVVMIGVKRWAAERKVVPAP